MRNFVIILAFQFLGGALFGAGSLLFYQWRERKKKTKLRDLRRGTRVE